jgi:hypothetical protein
VGKISKATKKNWVGDGEKIKYPQKKQRSGKKETGKGAGENKVAKKN